MKVIDRFKQLQLTKYPFLLFSPFLVLSVLIVCFYYDPCLVGDESKYLFFANNLINGYFSLPEPDLYLGVGPGYPLLLVPFIAFKLPLISVTLLNAVLYYFSIIILYKTIRIISTSRIALIVSLFWAFYYNLYENFSLILPEILTPFLVTLALYLVVLAFDTQRRTLNKYVILAGFTIGYLALTKIIFGYVLLFMIAGIVFLWLFNRKSANYKKSLIILLLGLASTLPYLYHSYQLTGRVFYWGTAAGNNMYWMSTPYEKEYGSWFPDPHLEDDTISVLKSVFEFRQDEYVRLQSSHYNVPGTHYYIWKNHHKNFEEINKYNGVEQDDALKKNAIQNIKSHPVKYIKNIISNIGRMLFNYPYSYKYQNPGTLLRFPPNGIIIVLLMFSTLPTVMNWKRIIFPIRFLIFFIGIYFGGSLTGSAETRMFTVIVPVLLFWITYILQKTVKINWKF